MYDKRAPAYEMVGLCQIRYENARPENEDILEIYYQSSGPCTYVGQTIGWCNREN